MGSDELDVLKSDPGVLRIYAQYVKLKRVGDKYVGCCPIHSEKSGSFTVFGGDMRAHCFGCGIDLNIFMLIQKMDNCSFQDAVDKVKKELGWSEARAQVDKVFRPVAEQKVYKTIGIEHWSKLESALKSSLSAIKFLQEHRGITIETAQKLRIGFAQSIGNLSGPDGSEASDKGWLAFPCIEGDKIISVKYRSIVEKRFARQPGMATALFNTETVDVFEPVYVTEGEFDACILEQVGFRAVSVPSAGSKLTPQQKDLLMKSSMVILSGDSDATGNGYMQKLWKELAERCFLLSWPTGMKDANQTFLECSKKDPQHFRKTVEELTTKAKSVPMPSIYSLQEAMINGEEGQLSDRSDRLRFPWPSVDKMLIILPGHVFGMGATNTGMGKTMWTVQASLHNAMKYGRTVINFQAEMDPSEIGDLAAAQLLRIDRNFLTKEDRINAAKQLEGVNYYVGRDPNLTELKEVLDLLEAAVKRLSPDIVILDHFHHFSAGADNETKAQSEAMTRIKQMADLYKFIFVNVGQPRKATSQSKGKKIHVTDFKGSGAWGDASNSVIIIHRDLNREDNLSVAKGPYEDKTLVQVLKGRSLGKGASAAYLTCFGEFGSFEEVTSNYEEVPG